MIGYLVKIFSGRLEAGDDAAEVKYFHPDRLPEIAFNSHREFIREYFNID